MLLKLLSAIRLSAAEIVQLAILSLDILCKYQLKPLRVAFCGFDGYFQIRNENRKGDRTK